MKKPVTIKDLEDTAIRLGAKPKTVWMWRYRGVPASWQLRLVKEGKVPPSFLDQFTGPYPIRQSRAKGRT
jgi:hypothetical protein